MLVACNSVDNKKQNALIKASSPYSFEIFSMVKEIPVDHWNSVAQHGSEFLDLNYLEVFESHPPQNLRFHYSIIYNGNTPQAVAYFQVVDFNGEGFGKLIEKKDNEGCCIADYFKSAFKNHILKHAEKMEIRLLICGNACISGEHGIAMLPGANKKELMDALADVIHEISLLEKLRGKIAAVLVKDFYQDSLGYSGELEEFKYHDFLVEPNMILPIEWKTRDEYFAALSKKYRQRAKGILKKGESLKKVPFQAEEILKNAEELFRLYQQVHMKAEFRLATLTIDYFAAAKRTLGDRFCFDAYYLNNRLVGFRSGFLLKDHLEAHFIGIDYSINKEVELYQNMLYDYLFHALESKKKSLVLGRTASEIKSNLGAVAYPLTCYIRHRNSLSNRIIKPFVDYLRPSDWTPRNPFKENSI